jgi:predicted transcriptional regulator
MRGKKTSEADKEKVKAVVYLNPTATHSDISRETGIPRPTIINMLKDENFLDKDKFDEARQRKKVEFINDAWEIVKKAALKINLKLDTMDAEALQKVNIRDLAVALGTIYDKQALASGEPTQISERVEPTPELVKEMEEKVQKLKQLTGS